MTAPTAGETCDSIFPSSSCTVTSAAPVWTPIPMKKRGMPSKMKYLKRRSTPAPSAAVRS